MNLSDENREILERSWFYIGTETGFVVSFWGVCGSLLYKRTWWHAYFKFLDNIKERVLGGDSAKIELATQPFQMIPYQ